MTDKTESFGKTYEYAIGHLGMYEIITNTIEPLYSIKLNTGFTMTASEYTEGAYAVTRLIDDDTTTEWRNGVNDTAWVQYHFDEPARIEQLVLCADGIIPERCPNIFTIKASNTGEFSGEETTLLTVNGGFEYTEYQGKYFNFSNPNSYSYYRVNMTGKQGAFGTAYEYIILEMYLNKRMN